MTSPVPLPPIPFPKVNTFRLAAGTPLHRTHARVLRPGQFNPGLGQISRFAPFESPAGEPVATLYAATSRQAAAFETLFHDIAPSQAFKTVRLDTVTARSVSQISPLRDLRLAALFTPDLKVLGLSRSDLIQTPKSTYGQTALWAQAIHRAHPHIDGLAWTSVQCDPDICVMLFEDRIAEAQLQVIARREVAQDPALLLELRAYGARAGISLVN